MSTTEAEKLESLKSHLVMVKSMNPADADDEFYALLEKAKNMFGDVHPYMAKFYCEYASFILTKMENSMNILNAGAVP